MNISHATIGQPINDLPFTTTQNPNAHFSDLKGKIIVLYFYPKDNTPGCTMEAKDFRDLYTRFLSADAYILGVSRDNLASHASFQEECALPFPLISDENQALCHYFDVIKEKNMYGKKVMGIQRSTFLIDRTGILRQEWRDVKVPEHAQAVLEAVGKLG